jgi:hypothetical protein
MYRTIDTRIWNDPWFADCSATEKLLFLYFVTSDRSTACGAYEIRIRDMAYETGLTEAEVTAGLEKLHPKVMWWPSLRVILIPNFYRHQRHNSNDKFTIAAAKALLAFPPDVVDTLCAMYPELDQTVNTLSGTEGYPPPSHPHPITVPPHRDGGKETVTVTESVTEEEDGAISQATSPAHTPPKAKASKVKETSYPDGFTVTDEMREKVQRKFPGLDIEAATEEWELSMRANRTKYKYSDWSLAWYAAMRRADEWQREKGVKINGQSKPNSTGRGAAIERITAELTREALSLTEETHSQRRIGNGQNAARR